MSHISQNPLPSLFPSNRALGVPTAGFFFYKLYTLLPGSQGSLQRARNQTYDPKTGIGKGAPGFQTGVKRIAVPPEIIARIRAGEEVSAEEITRAQEKMQKEAEEAERKASAGVDGEDEDGDEQAEEKQTRRKRRTRGKR
jgi:hypothetical protein